MLLFRLLFSISLAARRTAFSRFSSSSLAFSINSSKSRFSPSWESLLKGGFEAGLRSTVLTVVAVFAVVEDVNVLDKMALSSVGDDGDDGVEVVLDECLR